MVKYRFSKKHLLLLPFLALFCYAFPQGAIFFVCFFSIMGGIIFLALRLVRVLLAPALKRHENFLKANGFGPCTEEESRRLKETVGAFKTEKSPDGFYLDDPVKAEMNGRSVFQYYYNDAPRIGGIQRNSTRAVRQFEMIVPFPRRSSELVTVILKRNDGIGGMLQNVAGKLAPMAARLSSSQDHPVEVLKLPPELENGKILMVIGPPQRTVYQLLDPNDLEAIVHGAEVGVETITLAENIALVSFAGGYVTEKGYAKLPAYLAKLTSH